MSDSSSTSASISSPSSSHNSSNNFGKMSDADTKTLPRIGGTRKDADIWKYRIERWFKREGITTDDDKFSYIISSAEDDLVRALQAKEIELNKTPTLDECVEVIKKKYWRENKKEDKLRQFKRMIIEPSETVYDFNTRYLNMYSLLENEDRASISVIDYENALRPKPQIYQKIAMEEYDSLENACSQAEKYENILQESYYNRNIIRRNERNIITNYNNNNHYPSVNNYGSNWNKNNGRNTRNFRNSPIPSFNTSNNNNNSPRNNFHNNNHSHNNSDNNDSMDDLVNKMQQLQIKTCYFCHKPGHFIRDCADFAQLQKDPNFINYIKSQKN